MKVFLHIFCIVMIALSVYLVYGAWFKDFGKKHYDAVKRGPLSGFFMFFAPKTLPNYIKYYKASVLFQLFLFIAFYIFIICHLK